jgi:hypothetical protein
MRDGRLPTGITFEVLLDSGFMQFALHFDDEAAAIFAA